MTSPTEERAQFDAAHPLAPVTEWSNRIVGSGVVSPFDVLANPLNFREHPPEQVDAVRALMTDIGLVQECIINETTGRLLDGHLRMEIARADHQTAVPVKYVRLEEWEERIILASYDASASMALINQQALATLLTDIGQTSSSAINDLLSGIADRAAIVVAPPPPPQGPGAGGDDFEPPETAQDAPTRVQPDDLWQIGPHRMICADCRDKTVLDRLLGGERPSAVVADPPYGMRLDTDFSDWTNHLQISKDKQLKGGKRYDAVSGDDIDFDAAPFITYFADVTEQLWFGADYYASSLGDTSHTGAWLVWDKRLDESADKMFGSCFELIWSKRRCKRDILRCKWAGVFGMEHETQRARIHPNQKPVLLLEDLVERVSKQGDIVWDGFLGSGTTLVACDRKGRVCYGAEIEPRNADIILKRAEAEGIVPISLVSNRSEPT